MLAFLSLLCLLPVVVSSHLAYYRAEMPKFCLWFHVILKAERPWKHVHINTAKTEDSWSKALKKYNHGSIIEPLFSACFKANINGSLIIHVFKAWMENPLHVVQKHLQILRFLSWFVLNHLWLCKLSSDFRVVIQLESAVLSSGNSSRETAGATLGPWCRSGPLFCSFSVILMPVLLGFTCYVYLSKTLIPENWTFSSNVVPSRTRVFSFISVTTLDFTLL